MRSTRSGWDTLASVVNVKTVGNEDGFYSSLKGNELKRREEPSFRVVLKYVFILNTAYPIQNVDD